MPRLSLDLDENTIRSIAANWSTDIPTIPGRRELSAVAKQWVENNPPRDEIPLFSGGRIIRVTDIEVGDRIHGYIVVEAPFFDPEEMVWRIRMDDTDGIPIECDVMFSVGSLVILDE